MDDKIIITKADAEALLTAVRRVPRRLRMLVVQIVLVRRAFEQHLPLSECIEPLRVEIALAEHDAREVASIVNILEYLLSHADVVDGVWRDLNGWSN